MIKPILIYPRMQLRTSSGYPPDDEHILATIKGTKDSLATFIQDLFDTLDAIPNGVGLASNQLGNPDDPAAVLDPMKHTDYKGVRPKFYALYPSILEKSEPYNVREGCLSLPNYFETIERYNKVKVKYFTLESDQPVIEEADGALAQIWQHEIDHVNGICFVEHLSAMKREMAVKKMSKIRKRISEFEWTPKKQTFFGAKGS